MLLKKKIVQLMNLMWDFLIMPNEFDGRWIMMVNFAWFFSFFLFISTLHTPFCLYTNKRILRMAWMSFAGNKYLNIEANIRPNKIKSTINYKNTIDTAATATKHVHYMEIFDE